MERQQIQKTSAPIWQHVHRKCSQQNEIEKRCKRSQHNQRREIIPLPDRKLLERHYATE